MSCDCTAMCGDDPRIERGAAKPCATYLSWQRARRLADRAPELLRVTKRLQFLLTSAQLVIPDAEARRIAREALADAARVTEGL